MALTRRRSPLGRGIMLVVFVLAGSVVSMAAVPAGAAPAAHGWTELIPAASPPARSAAATAYDPAAKVVVAYGGFSSQGYLDDTWTWDGSTWTQAPASAPPARAAAGIGYDAVARTLVMFGGFDGHGYLDDTWVWDAAARAWMPTTPAHIPKAVTGPSLFTDPLNGRVDMVGGFDGVFYHNTTYQWTGSDWQTLQLRADPTARAAAVCVLDGRDGTVVLFGGLGDLMTWNTWTFDGRAWTLRSPGHQPPQRFYSMATYDPRQGGVFVFGGGSSSGVLADDWLWNGRDWHQRTPTSSPPARESGGMAYDGATRGIVLFGGDTGQSVLDDTWGL